MDLLDGVVRPYAWGSRTVLADLQGRPVPSPGPEAELWLGAHPGAPATVHRAGGPVPLPAVLAADPDAVLGGVVRDRYGDRLPYLLKVLAAEAPLSLQAHPDAAQARAGFAAERAGGPGNYVDDSHKPELLVALSPFEALCGFRTPAAAAAVFEALALPALDPVLASLRTGVPGLPDAVRTLLTWPEPERAGLVDAAAAAAGKAPPEHPAADSLRLVVELAQHYPGDPGVLVALLLNQVRLAPGEAIWMPAGNLHAYLRGAGVEIMAASDNVLRGGLTPKRVDVGELLRVLRFEVLADPVLPARPVAPGVVTWPVPVPDFALHRVRLTGSGDAVVLPVPGPRVVLCRTGPVTVDDGAGAVVLRSGGAGFAPAAGGPLRLSGAGEVYVASVGQ